MNGRGGDDVKVSGIRRQIIAGAGHFIADGEMIAVQERLDRDLKSGNIRLELLGHGQNRVAHILLIGRKINHGVDCVPHDNGRIGGIDDDDTFRFFSSADIANAPCRGARKLIDILPGARTRAAARDGGYRFGVLNGQMLLIAATMGTEACAPQETRLTLGSVKLPGDSPPGSRPAPLRQASNQRRK